MGSKRLEGVFYSLDDSQHAIPIDDQKYDVDEAAMGQTEEFFCTEKLAQSGAFKMSTARVQNGKWEQSDGSADEVDEITMNMSGIGDIMDDQEKLVVFFVSLSEDYKQIKMIMGNMHGIDLMTAREIIWREWDSIQVEASK